ncbi:MAG: hypothetical protein EBR23_14750, partial [Planctomycetia bacterium]|nr:hypothetical protein [Planctomycetia bacterium]
MTANESEPSFFARHQFLIYRLFSLSGLVPVGAFLVVHLLTNASVLAGPGTFQSRVDAIHSLGPLLVPIEWAFIFLPMIFHATVGFVIIAGGLPNVGSYAYVGNVRYTLQRATGMIAFAFIIWHVIQLHWMGAPLGGGRFDPHHATSSAATLAVNAATVAPAFTTQPSSQSVAPGVTVTFTAAASGTPTPTYQWQKGGSSLSGQTAATLSLSNVQPA